jgi:hypothetical protein
MPAAIPAIIGLAVSAAAQGAGYGIFAAGLAGLAASTLVAGIVKPKPKSFKQVGVLSRTETIRQTDAPREYVYGRTKKSGPLAFHHTSADNKYFYMVIILASHSINKVERVFLGEDEVILTADSDYSTTGISHYKVTGGKYKDHAWIDVSLGSGSNDANSRFREEIGGDFFKSTDKFNGLSALYVKLKWNSEIYRGPPHVSAVIQGKDDILDTRDSTTKYTTNPALCLADYMKDTVIGVSAAASEFSTTALDSAANICDESVTTTAHYGKTYPAAVTANTTLDSRIHGSQNIISRDTSRTGRWISEGISGEYVQFQYDSATQVERIMLTAPAELNGEEMPTGWVLKASNTGAFAGEEVTLDTQSGVTWSAGQEKTFDFTNGSSYTYYRLDELTVTARPNISIATWKALTEITSEDRYTCNGTIESTTRISGILESFTSAMAGYVSYVNGKYVINAGSYQTPAITITENDIISEIGLSRPGRREKFNAVRGIYINEDEDWVATDFPHLTNSTYETEDGVRIYKDLELPFVISNATAQRIAKIDLERSRQDIVAEVTLSLQQWDIASGDTIMVTYSPFGWSSKVFDVLERGFTTIQDANGNEIFAVSVVLRETASTVYTWSEEETTIDPAPNTQLPNPFNVYPLENLILDSTETQLVRGQNGRIVTRIKANWSQHEDILVQDGGSIEIQYKKSSDSTYETASVLAGDRTFGFITDVDDRETYDVRVRAINVNNGKSEWTTVASHTVIGKTTPPPAVTGFEAAEVLGIVRFSWNQLDILDIYGYEIRYGVSGTQWKNATPLTKAKQGTHEVSAAVPPGTWVFLIKGIDYVGLYSNVAAAAGPIVVSNANSVLQAVADGEFPGTLDNMVKHYTNVLTPDDQNLASFYDFEVFDQYVPTPEVICTYTSDEIDLGSDQDVRIWGEIVSELGPGVTTGTADPKLQVCYRGAGDSSSGAEVTTPLISSSGTFTNCILHYTGKVVPDSQSLANAADFEVFDQFVYNPYENCTYEAPEQDLGADANVKLDVNSGGQVGPGESGEPEHTILIDTRTSAGSYDGFDNFAAGTFNLRYYKVKIEWNNISNKSYINSLDGIISCWRDWIIGNVNDIRYIQARIRLDTDVGNAKITDFNWVVDS